jgi:hypothetical protein
VVSRSVRFPGTRLRQPRPVRAAAAGGSSDYNTRLKHLSGGLNGSYRLPKTTIHDDSIADYLYGGGLDGFFAHQKGSNKDQVKNLATGEVVTSVGRLRAAAGARAA